ncbi:4-hydroxy-tetrahydrodipicolinate synthase [bacterium]|nr:4-hydroxy-tetrahydrodipicolinate synthase [bacterium]
MRSVFRGSIVAIVTPFNQDGSIDLDSLEQLVEWHIESGTNGILPCGTTGESPTLSHEEHDLVVDSVIKFVNKRIPVLAGAGSNSTNEALRLTKHAEDAGASGALVITPYYNKPTQAGLKAHFTKIASETNIPIVIYNVPGRTGISIAPETVAELAELKNIVAIKEASGSLDQASSILTKCNIDLLSGDDSLTVPLMSIGGCGIVSVVANIVPGKMAALTKAMMKGNLPSAEQLHRELYPLCKAMFIETNPVPVKTALSLMGKIEEVYRLPMVPISDANKEVVKKAIERNGVI